MCPLPAFAQSLITFELRKSINIFNQFSTLMKCSKKMCTSSVQPISQEISTCLGHHHLLQMMQFMVSDNRQLFGGCRQKFRATNAENLKKNCIAQEEILQRKELLFWVNTQRHVTRKSIFDVTDKGLSLTLQFSAIVGQIFTKEVNQQLSNSKVRR